MAAQNNEMAAGVTQIIADEWNDGLAKATPLWDTVVKGDGRFGPGCPDVRRSVPFPRTRV